MKKLLTLLLILTFPSLAFASYETVTYDHDRKMTETVNVKKLNSKDLTLSKGEIYHFFSKKVYDSCSGEQYHYYIENIEYDYYEYIKAKKASTPDFTVVEEEILYDHDKRVGDNNIYFTNLKNGETVTLYAGEIYRFKKTFTNENLEYHYYITTYGYTNKLSTEDYSIADLYSKETEDNN